MKRALIALPFLTAGLVLAAQSASPLAAWTGKLAETKTLKADVTVQEIGTGRTDYTITLQKPASLRVESPVQTVVADGKTLTVYDKTKNYWYTKPQDDGEVRRVLAPEPYTLVRAFFDAKAFDGTPAKAGASRTLGGETVKPVALVAGKTTTTIYIGADGVARKADRTTKTPDGDKSAVFTAKSLTLGAELPEGTFAFKAPESANEIQYADLIASKWFSDLEEAKAVAQSTGRKIFVDFYATWCGPCKRLDAEVFQTEDFKALSKKFVFLRVDVDAQPYVAQRYNIEAMPTQAILSADGTEIGRTVGYANPAAFFEFINAY